MTSPYSNPVDPVAVSTLSDAEHATVAAILRDLPPHYFPEVVVLTDDDCDDALCVAEGGLGYSWFMEWLDGDAVPEGVL